MKPLREVIAATPLIPRSTVTAGIFSGQKSPECELCGDAGWLRMDSQPGHPNFGRLLPCECLIRQREVRDSRELLELSNLDAFAESTFSSFDRSISGVDGAYEQAFAYAQQPSGWIFLHGNCGVGKTHLAVAIANYVMSTHRLSVYFRVVPDLLDQLRATFDPASGVAYDERFQQIRASQLLVLDDLGTEHTTAWAREKLYQLLNHRYNEQLPTVVTSNQDFRHIDTRVLSRLLDARRSRYVYMDTEDFRLQSSASKDPDSRKRR